MLGDLTKEEIEDVLLSNVVGRIGCHTQQKMYIVPISYAYDGESVLGHTVPGLKIDLLRLNPECCFEVDVLKDLANWKSVLAWGTFEELKGQQAEEARQKIIDRIAPLMPDDNTQPPRMGPNSPTRLATFENNPIVYRIKLKEKFGRFEKH
jgi:nitroimidazol reductase NimA-like FMN-containing flavoprotein (pyridoxamine 5'-phosphate oxidase superfamily)